jgi:hypothetical protein
VGFSVPGGEPPQAFRDWQIVRAYTLPPDSWVLQFDKKERDTRWVSLWCFIVLEKGRRRN